jgi:hypothetical protein
MIKLILGLLVIGGLVKFAVAIYGVIKKSE